ncbi:MAG: hypothetical protein LBQ66_16355 [Planctomycetaceae bacterium]|jgi:hypothetical protein|nr:hypothetical protein [Planctomycetaceae bacterium]
MPNFSESTVFNGKDWKNYDVVDGPIGERIFDIEICPKDGDVWMATSAGLTRFRLSHDWEHYTREDGLLEDQASSLAFKKDGTLIVGTQCHGLAIFARDADGHYTHERNIVAPERFGQDNCSPVPLTSTGKGLPSNLINDIIVAQNSASQTIWIATSAGLVKADNDLKNLEYQRGRDYAAKVHGLYGGAPKNFKAAPEALMKRLIPEDYLTALVEDGVGQIYVGMRQNGFLISDPVSGRRWFGTQKESGLTDNFVTKILILDDGNFLVGTYGGGVVKSTKPFNLTIRQPQKSDDLQKPNIVAQNEETRRDLPIEIKPPTIEDMESMRKQIVNLFRNPSPKKNAIYSGDDWKTQGDWYGRISSEFGMLCAMDAPFDHPVCFYEKYYVVCGFMGPNHAGDDSLRYWLHWRRTEDRRSLWDSFYGFRRQAEWDDHGEAYPMSKDGPDVWFSLDIHKRGIFEASMYFFNKDGHEGANRMRDYVIEVYPSPRPWRKVFEERPLYAEIAEKQVPNTPPLVKSRVRYFWGGVHKKLILRGPASYFVKIDRNYSFNTILSAVMVKQIHGEPTTPVKLKKFYGTPYMGRVPYEPLPLPASTITSDTGKRIIRVWNQIENNYDYQGLLLRQSRYKIALYQAAIHNAKRAGADDNDKQLAESLKWRLNQWDEKQREEYIETMLKGWRAYYLSNGLFRDIIKSNRERFPAIYKEPRYDESTYPELKK